MFSITTEIWLRCREGWDVRTETRSVTAEQLARIRARIAADVLKRETITRCKALQNG